MSDVQGADGANTNMSGPPGLAPAVLPWWATREEESAHIEMKLRREWWANHGHHGIYGDDGEMQCGECRVDYKRDPLGRVEEACRAARAVRAKIAWDALEALKTIRSMPNDWDLATNALARAMYETAAAPTGRGRWIPITAEDYIAGDPACSLRMCDAGGGSIAIQGTFASPTVIRWPRGLSHPLPHRTVELYQPVFDDGGSLVSAAGVQTTEWRALDNGEVYLHLWVTLDHPLDSV